MYNHATEDMIFCAYIQDRTLLVLKLFIVLDTALEVEAIVLVEA